MGLWKNFFSKNNKTKNRQDKAPSVAGKNSLPGSSDNAPPVAKAIDISERNLKTRSIRIFISSTFQDMQQERDILVKEIFPQLRRVCSDRGVGFTEVDLRWGVTEKQAERGEVLPICLAEIDNCRPYFIGLLGERYGWVPDFIPEKLLDGKPWLKKSQQQSITELEIEHGVLRNPTMAGHAFFYFRDPSASPGYPEKPEESRQQETLKKRIKESGFPVYENYPDAETVGQLILNDLQGVIDNEYPKQQYTRLQRERLDHEAFSEIRTRVYIGRQVYFDRLDGHVQETGTPLVVLGESGSGKSALLANWSVRFREKNPDMLLLTHFIGSSTDSADYAAMLRRIILEIKEHYDLQDDIPDTTKEIVAQFPNWLTMAASQGGVVIVLDALNQLEGNTPDLDWLYNGIPPEVRLIVSSLPGSILDELEKRNFPTLKVHLLDPKERQQLIEEYLLQLYSKKLPGDMVLKIASQEQCANPLFLHALLEELRIFGKHEEIQHRITHYLQADDPGRLYELILTRLEEDYEKDHPGLVGQAMSLVFASRQGLSEPELLEIMGVPRLLWTPLFLALQDSLFIRSGLLNFFHDFLKQAVSAKYLHNVDYEEKYHHQLADYFEHHEIDRRKIAELPWQLNKIREWKRLASVLGKPVFFNEVWMIDRQQVKRYWANIGKFSDINIVDVYKPVIEKPRDSHEYVWNVSMLLSDIGHHTEALPLIQIELEKYRQHGDWDNVVSILGNLAKEEAVLGRLDQSLAHLKEAETICQELNQPGLLLNNISNQLQILRDMGKTSEAKVYLKKYLQLTEGKDNKSSTLHAYCNKATVFYDEGNLDQAFRQLSEAERLALQLNDQNQLAWVLDMQGLVLHDQGKSDIAMQLYRKAMSLSEEIGDKDIYQKSLGHMAWIVSELGDNHQALEMFQNQEQICSEIDNAAALSFAFSGQSAVYRLLDMRKEALQCLIKQEEILLKLNNRIRMLDCLNNQALLHHELGDTPVSLICIEKQLVICRELGNPRKMQELEQMKRMFECHLSSTMPGMDTRGGMESRNPAGSDFDEHQLSLEVEKQAAFFLSSGNFGAYFDYLVDKANAFALKRSDLILILFFNFEAACKREEQWGYVQKSMNTRAEIQEVRGNTSQAITLWEGAFAFAESRDDDVGMCDALVGMASNFKSMGNMPAAHKKYNAAEEIARKSENHQSLVFICNNNANVLNKMGNHQDAVILLQKALTSAQGLQDYKSMAHIGRSLGNSLIKMEQYDEGLDAYRESIRMSRKFKDTSDLVSDLIYVANEILQSTPDQWEIAESYLQEIHRLQSGLQSDNTVNEEIKCLTIKLQEFSHISNTENVSIPLDDYNVWPSTDIAREVLLYEDGNVLIKEVPKRPIRNGINDVIRTYIQQLQSGILQQMLSAASCLGNLKNDAVDSIPYLLDIACNTFMWQVDENQFNPNAMYANQQPSPGSAAAEALMKIGEPAVPALTGVADDSKLNDVDREKARLILRMISTL